MAAGVAITTIDSQLTLEEADAIVHADIVAERSAAGADGGSEDLFDCSGKGVALGAGQSARSPARSDAGAEAIQQLPNDGPLAREKFLIGKLLHCVYQGSKNSSQETLESARDLCASLGAQFSEWSIDDEVESSTSKLEKVIGRKLDWERDDIALQNIQARVRSPQIWMLANIKGALLIATSNRSEGDTGYATMDGDTSGSISPIAGVDKQFIRQWLEWAEVELDFPALKRVNTLTPSAELRPQENQQTDEGDLMPYDILVELEKLAIRDRLSPVETYNKLAKRDLSDPADLKLHVAKFYTLWSRSQWKRERLAPSFHLDDFNIDPKTWCRFPILSAGFKEELEELDNL